MVLPLNISNCTPNTINCIVNCSLNITHNSTNCTINNQTHNSDKPHIIVKIIAFIFLGIICIFLLLLLCIIFNCLLGCICDCLLGCAKESLKSATKSVKSVKSCCISCIKRLCYKDPIILTYQTEVYNFSVENCSLINPNRLTDEPIPNSDCAICIDPLINLNDPKQQRDLLKINKCQHLFHINCVYPWFNQRFSSSQDLDCPLCRTKLNRILIDIPTI